MAVSSVTVYSPQDNFEPAGLRPATSIRWVGGVGSFDVLYEWDDVNTFDSGNLITVANNGVTSPDEAVPTSDLGPFDTDWYLRVSITDNDDDTNEIQRVTLTGVATPTATASHTSGGFPASNTIDGNTGTEWRSGISMTSAVIQLDYDFGAAVTLDKIVMLQSASTDWSDSTKVYWSDDGSGYTLINTFSTSQGSNDMTWSALTHRYWRVEDDSTRNFWWRVQTMEFFSTPTAGTFKLDFEASVTAALDWDISLAAMETAIEGLTGITDVTVTGTVSELYDIEFNNPGFEDVTLLVVDDDSLTPTSNVITVVETIKGSLAAPTVAPGGAGFYTLLFVNPDERNRYLYLYHNVGVGFGAGLPDGDPIEFPRVLYLNHNIDSTVPVPWIRIITPVILSQGDGLAIYGQGFDNVARDWNAEARLYNTPELDDTFVALSETGFVAGSGADEDLLTVTVPGGSTSGWVVVMNDNGL